MTINGLKVLLLSAGIVFLYYLGKKSIHSLVQRIGRDKNIAFERVQYVKAVMILAWSILTFIALGMVIGIEYRDLGLFFGSIFAVVGVALFAQWSILSNVTASIIIFFFFPYRVGDLVKIIDGENTVEGVIYEISLFHVLLENEKGITTYPNAMVFQKAVEISKPPPTNSNNPKLGDNA